VYRLENGKAVAVPVEIGISDGKYGEVIGGNLKAGDAVILEDLNANMAEIKAVAGKQNFRIKAF
jgi:HlyD family secretion protein